MVPVRDPGKLGRAHGGRLNAGFMVRARYLAALAPGCVFVACASTALPGTPLGTFKVTALALTNTCGLGAPDPWTFDVELSRSGSTVYWSWMDGSAPLSGPVSASSQARFTNSEAANVDGTDASLGPCTLQRSDDLEIDLAPTAFTGTIGYSFSIAGGADCSDQLITSGGQYQTLPCSMTYSVAASRQ
jgi:hypothetical protein